MLAAWRDTAPAAPSSLGRNLRLQAELAPGTEGPSSPISQGGYPTPYALPVSQVLPYNRAQPGKTLSSPSILTLQ